ncbi:NKAP domain containing 1 [Limanda limanda]|uniref:NKAP domain containing 1 n=1 Tax=Limanda limanda TaxID=27771 RepID=UPI0029C7BC15|nr:NKAP domain containing 1 [Limanda limanda]XP_060929311.1 NKAP domain containing 1 [Limanda limanda]
MSFQPLGKTLLRNVIRHTDAHNKIQEESEMWKMRGWQVQRPDPKQSSDTVCVRGQMHCDRGADQTGDLRRSRERVSEHDDREARYWTRKLYEFEAKDPDRWGHSGFKELYPEEFKRDRSTKKHKRKKSKSDTEGSLSRHSKKSSRKTKKKKKKKDDDSGPKKVKCSSSGDSSGDSSSNKDKQARKRSKSRHKDKKSAKSRGKDDDSSSGGSDDGERKRRTHSRKKRKQDFHKDSESGLNLTKKRKNWKAAGEGSSADSSAD